MRILDTPASLEASVLVQSFGGVSTHTPKIKQTKTVQTGSYKYRPWIAQLMHPYVEYVPNKCYNGTSKIHFGKNTKIIKKKKKQMLNTDNTEAMDAFYLCGDALNVKETFEIHRHHPHDQYKATENCNNEINELEQHRRARSKSSRNQKGHVYLVHWFIHPTRYACSTSYSMP